MILVKNCLVLKNLFENKKAGKKVRNLFEIVYLDFLLNLVYVKLYSRIYIKKQLKI